MNATSWRRESGNVLARTAPEGGETTFRDSGRGKREGRPRTPEMESRMVERYSVVLWPSKSYVGDWRVRRDGRPKRSSRMGGLLIAETVSGLRVHTIWPSKRSCACLRSSSAIVMEVIPLGMSEDKA